MYKLKDFAQDISVAIKDVQSSPFDRFVGLEHYDSGEPVITRYTDKSLLSSSVKEFRKNDILIARRNVYLKRAGIAFFDGLTSGDSIVLRVYDDCESRTGISKQDAIRIIPFILNSNAFWAYANKHADGMNSKRISKEMLYDYEFDLPPIAEQKVLADKLWAAYRLKESYKKLLAATEEMVKSQFIEMFGTIDEPKVEVKKLIDVVLSSGQYGSNTSATDYQEGKPRYIRITDINDDGSLNDDIKTAEVIEDKYRLIPGDIVFARTGATVGKTYMHETGNAIYAGYLIKYQMNESKMKPAFMKAFTHSKTYYNWVANSQKVGAQPNISAAQYDNMPVLVPQIEKQEEFLAICHQADKSKFVGFKSQFIEMFYNEKYPLQKLKTHIDVIRGVSYKPVDIKEETSDSISVILRSNNISNGQINFDDVVYVDNKRVTTEQVLSKGDIVMCGSNGSKKLVGKAAMINTIPSYRTSFGAFCLGIRCKESILPEYLSVYFQTPKYREVIEFLGSGSNILNIKPEHIYNLKIPIPSLEDQKHFVTIAEQADKSKLLHWKSIKYSKYSL